MCFYVDLYFCCSFASSNIPILHNFTNKFLKLLKCTFSYFSGHYLNFFYPLSVAFTVYKLYNFFFFVAGTDNDAVHRFPGPDFQQLLRVPGWKRRRWRRREEYRRLLELRGRPLVGRHHRHHDRLRRHRSQDVDGENSRLLFQCVRYFFLRSSSREYLSLFVLCKNKTYLDIDTIMYNYAIYLTYNQKFVHTFDVMHFWQFSCQ